MADPLAEAAAAAMDAQSDVTGAQRALLEAVGTITDPEWHDVGSPGQSILVVLPGWQSLEPPGNYILYPVVKGA